MLTSFPGGTNDKRPNTRHNCINHGDIKRRRSRPHTAILTVFLMYNRADNNFALAATKRQQQEALTLEVDIIPFLVC